MTSGITLLKHPAAGLRWQRSQQGISSLDQVEHDNLPVLLSTHPWKSSFVPGIDVGRSLRPCTSHKAWWNDAMLGMLSLMKRIQTHHAHLRNPHRGGQHQKSEFSEREALHAQACLWHAFYVRIAGHMRDISVLLLNDLLICDF